MKNNLNNHIKAVIWDMDGVMIDTEEYWPKVERAVFGKVGVPENEDFENATTGLRALEVVHFWHKRYPWNTNTIPFKKLQKQIIDQMIDCVEKNGCALPGLYKTLSFFKENHLIQIIASSSPIPLIKNVIKKLKINSYISNFFSGEDEKFGKPAPDIYLNASKKINTNPFSCLVIEDSLNGALAAHRAKMKLIIVPNSTIFKDKQKLSNFQKIPNAIIVKNLNKIKHLKIFA